MNHTKSLDYQTIINPRYIIYYNKYNIYSNNLSNENSLIMKVYPNQFYFKLLITNRIDNNRNIYFYENYYDSFEIKKLINKEKEEKYNLENIINIINNEFEKNNIEIINNINTKIKILFKNYNNIYIELLKVELYQEIKIIPILKTQEIF